jgi:hypothetical protein
MLQNMTLARIEQCAFDVVQVRKKHTTFSLWKSYLNRFAIGFLITGNKLVSVLKLLNCLHLM